MPVHREGQVSVKASQVSQQQHACKGSSTALRELASTRQRQQACYHKICRRPRLRSWRTKGAATSRHHTVHRRAAFLRVHLRRTQRHFPQVALVLQTRGRSVLLVLLPRHALGVDFHHHAMALCRLALPHSGVLVLQAMRTRQCQQTVPHARQHGKAAALGSRHV